MAEAIDLVYVVPERERELSLFFFLLVFYNYYAVIYIANYIASLQMVIYLLI